MLKLSNIADISTTCFAQRRGHGVREKKLVSLQPPLNPTLGRTVIGSKLVS